MKVIFIFLLLLVSINLFSQNNEAKTIMLKMVTKGFTIDENAEAIFRSGVEEILTENKYSLISEEIQNETLKEQAEQRKKECLDESCLVDTGKMLAARMLFIIEVIKSDETHLFKIKYIDLQTSELLKTKSLIFEDNLNDVKKLFEFSKKLTSEVLDKSINENQLSEFKERVKEVKLLNEGEEPVLKKPEIKKSNNENMVTIPAGEFMFGVYNE